MTDEPGIRELTLTRYPYKIYYEVSDDEVRILQHTARTAPAAEPATSVNISANIVARIDSTLDPSAMPTDPESPLCSFLAAGRRRAIS